jgi:hypothetical protein
MTAPEDLTEWRGLLRAGGWALLVSIALIPVQLLGFAFWPPPKTIAEAFALFDKSTVQGLLGLDLLYLVTNLLILPAYLALTVVLWRASRSAAALGLLLASVGMAALAASNRSLELMSFAEAHTRAGLSWSPELGAATAAMATWKGSGFVTYYLLNAIALFLFSGSMLRSEHFGRATARLGLVAAFFMLVPSTFGSVGLVFSLASLVPWIVFGIITGRRLILLAR